MDWKSPGGVKYNHKKQQDTITTDPRTSSRKSRIQKAGYKKKVTKSRIQKAGYKKQVTKSRIQSQHILELLVEVS